MFGGEHQYRQVVALGTDPPAHRQAIDVGHHDVQNENVGAVIFDGFERLGTGDGMPRVQVRGQRIAAEVVRVGVAPRAQRQFGDPL